jgi:glycosyltransferase involved in cell wall biosynthesis
VIPTPSILVISQLFYPELISSGQTVTELCEALSDQGEQIEVWCAQPTLIEHSATVPQVLSYHGIQIYRVWSTRFPKLSLLGKLLNHLSFSVSVCLKLLAYRPKTPVIIFTNPPFLWIFVGLINRMFKRPTLQVMFDVYPDTLISCNLISERHVIAKLWRFLNTLGYHSVDAVAVLGRCMLRSIQMHFPVSCHDKLHSIPLWCDPAQFTLDSPVNYREKWELTGKFVLLYSGNMGWFHDVETFAEAALALKHHRDIAWVFVGAGKKKKWLQEFVLIHDLSDHIFFYDYVPREELGALLSMADVGLVSLLESQVGLSVPSKTFGLMAAGVPVLGVLPSTCEITLLLQECQGGIVVHPGEVMALTDAVLSLYQNAEKRNAMGQNAKRLVLENYQVSHAAGRYQELLKSLKVKK